MPRCARFQTDDRAPQIVDVVLDGARGVDHAWRVQYCLHGSARSAVTSARRRSAYFEPRRARIDARAAPV